MDELENDQKPVTWLDNLTDLIRRKREENEILKKIYSEMVHDQVQDIRPKPDAESGVAIETEVL